MREFAIVVCLFLLLPIASADTVRLKDGSVVQGDILDENSTQLTIELQYAGGTITKTRSIKKSDIADIQRLPPEQRARRDMELAYRATRKYILNPAAIQTLSVYEPVIHSLEDFLSRYPDSPQASEVSARIADWKFAAALEKFGALSTPATPPAIRSEATRMYAETARLWMESMERQRTQLAVDLRSFQGELEQADYDKNQAENRLSSSIAPATAKARDETTVSKLRENVERARARVLNAEDRMAAAQTRLSSLTEQTAALQTMLAAHGASAPSAISATSPTPLPHAKDTAPAPAPPSPPALIAQIGDMLKNYWIFGLIGVVGLLWLVTRIFTRE